MAVDYPRCRHVSQHFHPAHEEEISWEKRVLQLVATVETRWTLNFHSIFLRFCLTPSYRKTRFNLLLPLHFIPCQKPGNIIQKGCVTGINQISDCFPAVLPIFLLTCFRQHLYVTRRQVKTGELSPAHRISWWWTSLKISSYILSPVHHKPVTFGLHLNFTWPDKAGLPPATKKEKNKVTDMLLTSRFSRKYNERQICLINYLKSQLKPGSNFFKSKYIAKDTGLSSKEVGTNMAILSEICPEFKIERYSYSNSTTWLVTVPQV